MRNSGGELLDEGRPGPVVPEEEVGRAPTLDLVVLDNQTATEKPLVRCG